MGLFSVHDACWLRHPGSCGVGRGGCSPLLPPGPIQQSQITYQDRSYRVLHVKQTGMGGGGRSIRKKFTEATVHKMGQKYQHD
jgi:hypothetical protein